MSLRFLAAPALIAAAFAPAISQAQQSQITIQTQATVMVPPDRGTVPVIMTVRGKSEREARANLQARDKEVREQLAGLAFKPSQISPLASSAPEITEQPDYEGCAADATAIISVEAKSVSDDPAEAAANAAREAAEAAEAAAMCDKKIFVGKRQLLIQIDGSDQEQALTDAERNGDLQFGKAVWSQSDPAGAKQKARDAAMAQARQEADATAASMGYRITGISRISTAPAAMSMDGLIRFLGEVDGPGRKRGPEWYLATTSQTVTIDFIAVPK